MPEENDKVLERAIEEIRNASGDKISISKEKALYMIGLIKELKELRLKNKMLSNNNMQLVIRNNQLLAKNSDLLSKANKMYSDNENEKKKLNRKLKIKNDDLFEFIDYCLSILNKMRGSMNKKTQLDLKEKMEILFSNNRLTVDDALEEAIKKGLIKDEKK